MALKNYKLDGAPTAKVKIEGKTYDVDLGNITFVVEANSWAQRLSSFAGLTNDEVMDNLTTLADEAHNIVAFALGEEAAEELIGQANRLNIYRLMKIISILTEVYSASDAVSKVSELITQENSSMDE
ncbi:MAG: hypothetical protein E6063_00060 [Atopobium sp.]|nr:hypothetical protein [Atopobium sp.]